MTIAALKSVFDRAESWSDEDQLRLALAAKLIEEQRQASEELTAEDWAIIGRRAAAGDIASDRERAEFFAKYKRQ